MSSLFKGVPRALVNQAIGDMAGFRELGQRMLARARAMAPVGEEGDEWVGPHLRDALTVQFITGTDPRILIGARGNKGDTLYYVTTGHGEITPKQASVLRFTSGGQVVFAQSVGPVDPNTFLMDAIRAVAQEAK